MAALAIIVAIILMGLAALAITLGGLYASSYVVLRECRHCGREMAIGTRSDLRRQGWRVSLGVCKHCQDRVIRMSDDEIEALIEGAEGPS